MEDVVVNSVEDVEDLENSINQRTGGFETTCFYIDTSSTKYAHLHHKIYWGPEQFNYFAQKTFTKLEKHLLSPSSTNGFRQFFLSWQDIDEIIGVGSRALIDLADKGKLPGNLREAYAILHVAYGLSQCDSDAPKPAGNGEFRRTLRLFKRCIQTQDQQEIFDEIATLMAEEFECALKWMKENQVNRWMDESSTPTSTPQFVSEWLRKAWLREALSIVSSPFGQAKNPPSTVSPCAISIAVPRWDLPAPPKISEFIGTVFYEGVMRSLQVLKQLCWKTDTSTPPPSLSEETGTIERISREATEGEDTRMSEEIIPTESVLFESSSRPPHHQLEDKSDGTLEDKSTNLVRPIALNAPLQSASSAAKPSGQASPAQNSSDHKDATPRA
ncbi:hypothetical protein ABW19_dt0209475 [Dactylella cylindrospora]|nr:hypothetical protein ABW19_dt0209475 [Dactylella cylindrospora]